MKYALDQLQLGPLVGVILGGLIGFASSFFFWHKSIKREERRGSAELVIRIIGLSCASVVYARSLRDAKLDAKREGRRSVHQLGPDPVMELIAITSLSFGEVSSYIRDLQDRTMELYQANADGLDFNELAFKRLEAIEATANKLNEVILEVARKEGLDKGRYKGELKKFPPLRREKPSPLL